MLNYSPWSELSLVPYRAESLREELRHSARLQVHLVLDPVAAVVAEERQRPEGEVVVPLVRRNQLEVAEEEEEEAQEEHRQLEEVVEVQAEARWIPQTH